MPEAEEAAEEEPSSSSLELLDELELSELVLPETAASQSKTAEGFARAR